MQKAPRMRGAFCTLYSAKSVLGIKCFIFDIVYF